MLMPWTLAELGVTQWWMLLICAHTRHTRTGEGHNRGGVSSLHLHQIFSCETQLKKTSVVMLHSHCNAVNQLRTPPLRCSQQASEMFSTHYSWAATVLPDPQPPVLCCVLTQLLPAGLLRWSARSARGPLPVAWA